MTKYEFTCERCGGIITHLCEHNGVWTCPRCDGTYEMALKQIDKKKKCFYLTGSFEAQVHAYDKDDARDVFHQTIGEWMTNYHINNLWEVVDP
jgi:hypothetical protein